MRMFLLAVLVVGCGGGPSITVDPGVAISSSRCTVNSLGLVAVNVDYVVTGDSGRGFIGVVDLLDTANPGQENSSFFCNGWSPTIVGGREVGCQRDRLDQAATVTIEHLYNTQPPVLPNPTRVSLLGSVVQDPGGDFMIANDQDTLNCLVN